MTLFMTLIYGHVEWRLDHWSFEKMTFVPNKNCSFSFVLYFAALILIFLSLSIRILPMSVLFRAAVPSFLTMTARFS